MLIKKEITVADLLKLLGLAIGVIVFYKSWAVNQAILEQRVNQHGKSIEQHDKSIAILQEVSVRQQVVLEYVTKNKP